jgi:hypothetical protein
MEAANFKPMEISMWLCLRESFLSIVSKDCQPSELLVRARRPGDIERVFPDAKVTTDTAADYLYRSVLPRSVVKSAIAAEIEKISYPNFKASVEDHLLHDCYMDVWAAMAGIQPTPPYSGGFRKAS